MNREDLIKQFGLSFALAGTAFVPPAYAQDLISLGFGPAGTELLADRISLRTSPKGGALRSFTAVQVWVTYRIPAKQRSGARTERSLISFNCANGTSAILAYQNYLVGTTKLQDWRGADIDIRYAQVKPDSLTAITMTYACSGGRVPVVPKSSEDPSAPTEEGD
jgi:hypothetical protein